jgi:hypothetical protein
MLLAICRCNITNLSGKYLLAANCFPVNTRSVLIKRHNDVMRLRQIAANSVTLFATYIRQSSNRAVIPISTENWIVADC